MSTPPINRRAKQRSFVAIAQARRTTQRNPIRAPTPLQDDACLNRTAIATCSQLRRAAHRRRFRRRGNHHRALAAKRACASPTARK